MSTHEDLLERMRHLPPIRNINGIRTWIELNTPFMLDMFDRLIRDAAKGKMGAPKAMVRMMFMAFAAGRAYQEANPDAPRDPDGYGG